MSTALPFVLSTCLTDLYKHGFSGLGPITTKKLTEAVAAFCGKPIAKDSTVEDLLNYLPMRYEDRSKLGRIADLREGAEVSLELWTRIAGGFQVGRNRGPKQRKTSGHLVVCFRAQRRGHHRLSPQTIRTWIAVHCIRKVGVGCAAKYIF